MINDRKRNILVFGAIALATASFFSIRKYNAAKTVVENLKVKIFSISNVNFQLPDVSFDVVLEIINPTNIDFGATLSSKITISSLRAISSNGLLIGEANSNLYSIQLPANSSVNLPKINVKIDGENMLQNVLDSFIYQNQSNVFQDLKFEIDLNVFGKKITLLA